MRYHVCYLLLLLCAAGDSPATIVVSSASGGKLVQSESEPWASVSDDSICPDTGLRIGERQFQEMDGFGGSFLRSGAILLNSVSASVADAILTALFDPDKGAGFSIGKVPIGATDFQPPVWYTYEHTPGNFSIAHDLDENGTIPYIRKAMKYMSKDQPLLLESCMDYPPNYMLNTTTPLPGAELNRTLYPELAQYYLKFAQSFIEAGAPITYVSLFNEPVQSYCNATNNQIADLLVNHVGPLFRSTPGAPKLTWGEQYGRDITLATVPDLLNRTGVQDYVDILFYHGYDCGDAGGWTCNGLNCTCPNYWEAMGSLRQFGEMYPKYKLWMTELCYAVEFGDYPPPPYCPHLPRPDFEDGLQWGRMIFGDIGNGASGWIYWNMLLNTSGGPFLVSTEHEDPVNNYQQPVIIVDTEVDTFTLTGCYYFMAHFSKYIRRGYRRVELARGSDLSINVYALAFVSPDGMKYVVQLMNDKTANSTVPIVFGGKSVSVTLPPVSVATVIITVDAHNRMGPLGYVFIILAAAVLLVAVPVIVRLLRKPDAHGQPLLHGAK